MLLDVLLFELNSNRGNEIIQEWINSTQNKSTDHIARIDLLITEEVAREKVKCYTSLTILFNARCYSNWMTNGKAK